MGAGGVNAPLKKGEISLNYPRHHNSNLNVRVLLARDEHHSSQPSISNLGRRLE